MLPSKSTPVGQERLGWTDNLAESLWNSHNLFCLLNLKTYDNLSGFTFRGKELKSHVSSPVRGYYPGQVDCKHSQLR